MKVYAVAILLSCGFLLSACGAGDDGTVAPTDDNGADTAEATGGDTADGAGPDAPETDTTDDVTPGGDGDTPPPVDEGDDVADEGTDDGDDVPTDDGTGDADDAADQADAPDEGDAADTDDTMTDEGDTADEGDADPVDTMPPPDDGPPRDPCACPVGVTTPVCSIDGERFECRELALCDPPRGGGLTEEQIDKCPPPGCRCEEGEDRPWQGPWCTVDDLEYTSICDMRKANDCRPWSELMAEIKCTVSCARCNCDCPGGTSGSRVCGSDGVTYDSQCHLVLCSDDSPTAACPGACFDFEGAGCADCDQACHVNDDGTAVGVCGRDGATYPNSCAAECAGTTVFYAGTCGQPCESSENQPVCGTDNRTYANPCAMVSAGVSLRHEGECSCDACDGQASAPVCGPDGRTYRNQCVATVCEGVAEDDLVEGACACDDCPNRYEPVCGDDGVTYANDCLASCSGANAASEGLCDDCATATDCQPFNQVCKDGITYPSAFHLETFQCAGRADVTRDTKGPCSACEEDADCHDIDPCTTDSCDTGTGMCVFTAIEPCDATNPWAPSPTCN